MSKHPIWCGLLPLSAFLGNLNPLVVNIFGLVFSEQNPLLVAHYIALACWLPFACDHRLVAQTPVVSEQRSSTTRNLRLKNSQLFQQKNSHSGSVQNLWYGRWLRFACSYGWKLWIMASSQTSPPNFKKKTSPTCPFTLDRKNCEG